MKEPASIDWMTGLPTVPDNYFWSVSKRTEQVHMDTMTYTASNGGLTGWVWKDVAVVTLMRKDHIITHKWWNDYIKDVNVAAYSLTVCERTETIKDGVRSVSYDYSITPASILRTAKKVMGMVDQRAQEQARKKSEDKLMGNYPPKRLR